MADNSTNIESLVFKDITIDSLPLIYPYISSSGSLSCDYTAGGIYMWIDYFKYQYCIAYSTLFIKGVAQDDTSKVAFSLPLCKTPESKAIELLKKYCATHNLPLEFSAISEEILDQFKKENPKEIIELEHWADYIYSAEALATLKGNKLSKKRNHVNRFFADYPQAKFSTITPELLPKVHDCFNEICNIPTENQMAIYERKQVWNVLNTLDKFPFETGCLIIEDKVVAFTVGEVIGKNLYVHIEKALHKYNGATQTINKTFVADILSRHKIEYVNREDDAGDEGLRKTKMSYHPMMLLKKYNVIF